MATPYRDVQRGGGSAGASTDFDYEPGGIQGVQVVRFSLRSGFGIIFPRELQRHERAAVNSTYNDPAQIAQVALVPAPFRPADFIGPHGA